MTKTVTPGRLKVGDIIIVNCVLQPPRNYTVERIYGRKAYTKFRTFHTAIYQGKYVYEFGQRQKDTTNVYMVKE